MTRDEFNQRYELLKEVGGAGGSFHALSAGGAVVMVHFLGPQDEADTRSMLDKVSRLEPVESRRVLEVTDVEGTAVVITKFITDFASLGDWLEDRVGSGPSAQPPATPPGTWTQPPAPPAPPPPHGSGHAPPPPPPAKPPGEFTRMFGGGSDSQPDDLEDWEKADTKKHPPAPAPEPGPAPREGPGEFTRMFGAQKPPAPPPDPPSDGPPRPSEPPPSKPAPPPPSSQLPPEFPDARPGWWGPLDPNKGAKPKEPGSFTKLFRSAGGAPEEPPPPPAPSGEPGPSTDKPLSFEGDAYKDRLREQEKRGQGAGPKPPPPPTRPPTPSGPGAYTRVIQGPAAGASRPPVPSAAPRPSAPPPPPKKARGPGLIIAAIGVIIAAILVVLIFAVLGRGAGEPADGGAQDEAPATEAPLEPSDPGGADG